MFRRIARWTLVVVGTTGLMLAEGAQAQQTPTSQTHTVREGDTLWDLARTYLGDPILWPNIYRMNTDVVEDPHWIYPGEVLRLVAGPDVVAVPREDTPAPQQPAQRPPDAPPAVDTVVVVSGPPPDEVPAAEPAAADEPMAGDFGGLFGRSGRERIEATLRAYTDQPYRPLRRSEFYSSGFLSEGDVMPYGRFMGPVAPAQIASARHSESVALFSRVAVQPPAGAAYQVGDTLLVGLIVRNIEGYGDVIAPTGLLRVTDVSQAENTAMVIALYGPMRPGQLLLPAERFVDAGQVRPVPISDGVSGTLIQSRDRQILKGPQDVVFIDKGRQDGVAPGDLFEVRRVPAAQEGGPATIAETMAVIQIVHVRQRTATGRILSVTSPNFEAGAPVRQVAKLPS